MVEYKRHKIDIKYRGRTYTRLADLAHAAGIPAEKVTQRWADGIRDISKLVYKGDLPITYMI